MSPLIKQFVLIRRRTGQSVQEFFDYHYQEHGRLSEAPSPEETPSKYYQTHFFDAIYSNTTLAQPAWSGHNDSTELYFKDMAHVQRVFGSQYVREVVGPDGRNFNDFAAAIPMFTIEELVIGRESLDDDDEQAIVATWWVQARDGEKEAGAFAKELNSLVGKAFEGLSGKVVANVALPDEGNILQYFRGDAAPTYSASYQVYLNSKTQIGSFLKAKVGLEQEAAHLIITNSTFVVFGIRSVVLDQTRGLRFDKSRQPRLT